MKSEWGRLFASCIMVGLMVLGTSAAAQGGTDVRRIASKVVDLGKVHKVYMVYGLATAIILPDGVSAVIPGNSVSLKIERKEPENLLALRLTGRQVPPTNLIILSGKNRLVFDVVPNAKLHQDTLEIIGVYGAANMDEGDSKLIYSGKL